MSDKFNFSHYKNKLIVIAGPCVAESLDILINVAHTLNELSKQLDFVFVFKSSFDKANRTSISSYRGEGLEKTLEWFKIIKNKFQIPILTDVHETHQIEKVAQICDVIQIPAFLCRQTDLLVKAVETKKAVNVKKGQFISGHSVINIINKAKHVCQQKNLPFNLAITERGNSFGYDSLIVDMKNFKIIHDFGVPVFFDCTHSVQKPPSINNSIDFSSGERKYIPLLARAAIATGYLAGLFLEVHPDPQKAKSDKFSQLSIETAIVLLEQLVPIWYQSLSYKNIDDKFNF